jgi:hypothetical protein
MSKGIRVYWHDDNIPSLRKWRRTRESFNIQTGMLVLKDLLEDPTVKIIAIGTEEGAMAIHYRRIWW